MADRSIIDDKTFKRGTIYLHLDYISNWLFMLVSKMLY